MVGQSCPPELLLDTELLLETVLLLLLLLDEEEEPPPCPPAPLVSPLPPQPMATVVARARAREIRSRLSIFLTPLEVKRTSEVAWMFVDSTR
jgi:hypothetical protein